MKSVVQSFMIYSGKYGIFYSICFSELLKFVSEFMDMYNTTIYIPIRIIPNNNFETI